MVITSLDAADGRVPNYDVRDLRMIIIHGSLLLAAFPFNVTTEDRGTLSRTESNKQMSLIKGGNGQPGTPRPSSSGSLSPGPCPALQGERSELDPDFAGAAASTADRRGERPSPSRHSSTSIRKRGLRFRELLRPIRKSRTVPSWRAVQNHLRNVLSEPAHRNRTVARVIRIRQSLQPELNRVCDQSSVTDQSTAFEASGVIYAIVCLTTKRIYVGQTIHSSLVRFRSHWTSAKAGAPETLHVAMRRFGPIRFALITLEHVKAEEYDHVRNTKADKFRKLRAFHKVATPREMFWIDRLRSFAPEGFNVTHSRRTRRRRRRVSNPMKRYKAKAVSAFESAADDVIDLDMHANDDVIENDEDGMDFKHVDRAAADPLPRKVTPGSQPAERWYGSRDWDRRLQYLAKCYANGKLDRVNFSKYSARSLSCMLSFLDAGESTISKESASEIMRALNGLLKLRMPLARKITRSKPFIRIVYTAHGLKSVGLKSILLESSIRSKFPAPDENFQEYVICKKLVEPIGQQLLNFRYIAKRIAHFVDRPCSCRDLFAQKFRPNDSCVLTGDLHIVQNAALRQLIANGPNFRDFSDTDVLDAIREGISEFIEYHSKVNAISRDMYNEWRSAVLDECECRIERSDSAQRTAKLQHPLVAKYLRFLQQHLVLVPVDKAAGNISFVCKRLYATILENELTQDDGAYEPETQSPDEILDFHRDYLKPMFLSGQRKLPYLYWTPKFHKVPIGQRFIAGSSNCSTTSCSKLLSDVLTHVMRTLRAKDDEHIRTTGVRRYFTVESFDEVAQFLRKWKRINAVKKVYTGDFSTMYTRIPHDDLIRTVRVACNEAFEWNAAQSRRPLSETRLYWSKSGVAWKASKHVGSTHSKSSHSLNVDGIVDLVSFLVSNTFLVSGSMIRRQKLGIPMGTNCAPVLANLYLYVHESEFIDKLHKTSAAKARQFHLTFRFIDDLLSLDNPNWDEAITRTADNGGLYPDELALSDTSISDEEANFLGMHIKSFVTRFQVAVYDKRDTFPFEVRRYPRIDSLIPGTIPYGVFTGQLHRGYRICSEHADYLSYAKQVAQRLIANGCKSRRLVTKFKSFTRSSVRKYAVKAATLVNAFTDDLGS